MFRVAVASIAVIFLFCGVKMGFASESIEFRHPDAQHSGLLTFIKEAFSDSNPIIANTDLNGDGLDEYFVKLNSKDTPCHDGQMCRYAIIVKNQNEHWEVIFDFQGLELKVSDHSTYGVKDIMVYDNIYNDFDYSTYVWNPKTSRYTLREQAQE